MPVTLAEAALNTQDDVDRLVIDEFRKQSALLDSLLFHDTVNPMGGGSTLTYGYHRVITERAAAFRAINAEYTPAEAAKERYTVDLKPARRRVPDRPRPVRPRPRRGDRLPARAAGQGDPDEVHRRADQRRHRGHPRRVRRPRRRAHRDLDRDRRLDPPGRRRLDRLRRRGHLLHEGARRDRPVALGPRRAALGHRRQQPRDRQVPGRRAAGQPVRRAPRRGADERCRARRSGASSTATPCSSTPGPRPGSNNPIIPVALNLTDLYAYRVGLDGFHGVTVSGQPLVRTWLPDFTEAGAVKKGEVEMGPLAVALKATKAATVLRGVTVS